MNSRAIAGIVSFFLAMTGLFLANLFMTVMIGEINRKREDERLVSYFGFTFPKTIRILKEYKDSYPTGSLHIYTIIAFGAAVAGLLSAAVCARIIG